MTKILGVIPAAGRASRLPNLSCSKEIISIKPPTENGEHAKAMPIITYLLERMKYTEVSRVFIVVNPEKWDIVQLLQSGKEYGLQISYLVQEERHGMPAAIDLAFNWVEDETVIFGMPDTIFYPENAYQILLENHNLFGPDLTLGLFPTQKPQKFGMVSFSPGFQYLYSVDKPATSDLEYMWGIACWSKTFYKFLHNYLNECPMEKEIVLGDVFQAAHQAGLNIRVFPFIDGKYVDIGTPDDLFLREVTEINP